MAFREHPTAVDACRARIGSRARRLSLRAALGASLAVPALLAGGGGLAQASGCPGANTGPGHQSIGRADEAILCLVNQARSSAGLRQLWPDGALGAAATHHSQDMVARGYFGHYSLSGQSPVERARQVGFCRRHCRVSEDLAWGTSYLGTPRATVNHWLGSPEHRAILLDPRQRLIGIGYAFGAPGQGGHGATVTADFSY